MTILRPGKPSASLPASGLRRLMRVQALVLLGGSVGANPFRAAIARSPLDLPLMQGRSLLDFWREHANGLSRLIDVPRLPVQVLTDRSAPAPTMPEGDGRAAFLLERDRYDYRGTGGVLSDLTREDDPDNYIVVCSAGQMLLEPLADLVTELAATGADVALFAHADGSPSSLMLIRCGCLRLVPEVGFADLKEQALPLIAKRHSVRVIQRPRPVGMPLRTLGEYVSAVRWYHRCMADDLAVLDPFAEDWQPVFSLVEGGAIVDATAQVHDSVVLRGGQVEPGAVLVRSVVCPGGIVRRGKRAVDRFVAPGNSG